MNCEICEALNKSGLKIYEDDRLVAILKNDSSVLGHIILVPKEHYPILEHVPDEIISHLFSIANNLSTICFEVLGAGGTNIIVNNGLEAGQTHPHFILNIVPRFENDNINFNWEPKKSTEEESLEMLAKLSDAINSLEGNIENPEPQVEQNPEEKKDDGTQPEDYLMKSLDRIP